MRVLILISGVFLLVNIVLYLLPTDIETSNLKYASDPEINQEDIRFLIEDQVAIEALNIAAIVEGSASDSSSAASQAISSIPVCYRIGPFLRETRMTSAGKQLSDLKVDFSLVERQPVSVSATRVFVGSFASASEAVAARQQLSKDGINDHFHRREPDGSYIVSLGIYSKKSSAEGLQKKFRDQNIAAKMRDEETRLPKNYWLELPSSINQDDIQSLLGISWGESSVTLGKHACQTSA
ncbi:MAG: SPOR domain-containing protein [Arenicella sp.]